MSIIWQLYLELFGTKPFFGMARVGPTRKIRNRNTRYAQDGKYGWAKLHLYLSKLV